MNKMRPLWQRLVYPLFGLLLVAVGLVGWALPFVPGVPLVIAGLPLLVCFWPCAERRVQNLVKSVRSWFHAHAGAKRRQRMETSVRIFFKDRKV